MKILIIHNHYIEKGGEDEVVSAEVKLLEEHGHKVILYEKTNEDIKKLSFFGKIRFFLADLEFSRTVYSEIKEIVKREKPDIAHIHNIFFCITPSVYFALKEERVPIVQSLHNYRLFCLRGTFFNGGAICERCKDGRFFRAVIGKCWRDSYVLSFLLAKLIYKSGSFLENIDLYIATSEFSRNKLAEFGLEKQKMCIKTNFLTIDPADNGQDKNYALFIGRLVDYKGIETLMDAFKMDSSFRLKIIGDGPLKNKVHNFACGHDNIEFLGRVERNLLLKTIKASSFIIFPSECYESMPFVIMEGLAFSKPILAGNLGAAREFVIEGVNGILFEPGNAKDLAAKISYLFSHDKERIEMGRNANKFYRERFDKEKNYNDLMNIYAETINSKRDEATCLTGRRY